MVVTGDGELGFDSRRGSLRNGYHIQGRQQARKLPNPDTGRASLVPSSRGNSSSNSVCTGLLVPSVGDALLALTGRGRASGAVTLKKLECSKQAYALDSRGHSYFIVRGEILGFMKDEQLRKHLPRMFSLIKNESWGARRRSDTVLVSTINDADQGSADVAFRTPLAPYEKSKFLGSGGSMVARLKL
ncbi:hypothetical protein L1887_63559 [Cichorium endivia]|nr:hypothetical protein L1887_63559 [Cichorium endivia]